VGYIAAAGASGIYRMSNLARDYENAGERLFIRRKSSVMIDSVESEREEGRATHEY
jgi:hypothetical protein